MKVTFLVRGKRYALKTCVVTGPDGKEDRILSILARAYQATWRPYLRYPEAYVGGRLAKSQGGTVKVVREKKDKLLDDQIGVTIFH